MIDGIKLLSLSLPVEPLLLNPQLLFPLAVDEQTGVVLDQPRQADSRGMRFTLFPSKGQAQWRCELKGSLHRYHNEGYHNADDFTVAQLLATIDELITTFQIDPLTSRLNNVEFGVNAELPFPVQQLLDNLIGYKYRPFTKEPGDGFAYYQCYTQRYIVKLYDKGAQYRSSIPGIADNILRFEIKVLKMEYLTCQGIDLAFLSDLLDVNQYERLGKLLVDTFSDILIDEPTIVPSELKVRQRELYLNGRNPKFWHIPDSLSRLEYQRHRKYLHRTEIGFRLLLEQHRQGIEWISQVATLISQKWQQLTAASDSVLKTIHIHRAVWKAQSITTLSEKRPKLTGVSDEDSTKVSQINQGVSEKCPKLTGVKKGKSSQKHSNIINSLQDDYNEKCPKLTGGVNTKMSQINRGGEGEATERSLLLTSSDEDSIKKRPLLTGSEGQLCRKLTGVDNSKVSIINRGVSDPTDGRETVAESPEKCRKLTGVEKDEMSQINPLSIVLNWDKADSAEGSPESTRGTPQQEDNLPLSSPVSLSRISPSRARLTSRVFDSAISPAPAIDNVSEEVVQEPSVPREPVVLYKFSDRPARLCPITGIDITHQRENMKTVSRKTIDRLSRYDSDGLDDLLAQVLTPEQILSHENSSFRLAKLIRKLYDQQKAG